LKEIPWPRDQVPPNAVVDKNELTGFYASVDLFPNVPILRQHLSRDLAGIQLPVTPGNRAVSIEIDAPSSALEAPTTRVDVVLSSQATGVLTSEIIVQNARVLSYGVDPTSQDQLLRRGLIRETRRTITLDVSPGDALKIQTAKKLGELSLMLRYNRSEPIPFDDISRTAKVCKAQGTMRMDGKEFAIDCDGRPMEIKK